MKKIIVHNPSNERTKNYRYYNYFFDQFTEHLKNFFEVEENRYFELAHSTRYPIWLQKRINDYDDILECEYVIENSENGEFVVMTISDSITGIIFSEKRNPYFKKGLVAQFLPREIYLNGEKYMYKLSPWVYFKSNMVDIEPYYQKRLNNPPTNNKICFRGVTTDRPIISHIDKNIITSSDILTPTTYFDDIITYKMSLSVDGAAEFCYRDIECFGLGVPILRFEYLSKMYNELIPNYHYISVPRPDDLRLYRLGNEFHARLIEKRHYEVLNDTEFLNFISKNARKYYEDNCQINNLIKNTHNLLNLNSWI